MKTNIRFLIISRSFLRMRKSCRENQNTHFLFSNIQKSCSLRGNVGKYSRAG